MKKLDFSHPLVFLAPMAGLTDLPMREMVAAFGVDAVVSEMMASQEWKTARAGVHAKAAKGDLPDEVCFVVQIAGRDPELMIETAKFAADQGADQIDINMGCPAKKVTSGATAGAALIREPDLALRLVEAVAGATPLPVSVKTRLGWDAHTAHEFAPKLVSAGAQMITIHGRTRSQKYTGDADHTAIAAVKASVDVPVIANGDIECAQTAKAALAASGANGVMIGRASRGRPELPALIRAGLGGSVARDLGVVQEVAANHYGRILSHYGRVLGMKIARKHLDGYFADEPEFKAKILREDNPDVVLRMMSEMYWRAAS